MQVRAELENIIAHAFFWQYSIVLSVVGAMVGGLVFSYLGIPAGG